MDKVYNIGDIIDVWFIAGVREKCIILAKEEEPGHTGTFRVKDQQGKIIPFVHPTKNKKAYAWIHIPGETDEIEQVQEVVIETPKQQEIMHEFFE